MRHRRALVCGVATAWTLIEKAKITAETQVGGSQRAGFTERSRVGYKVWETRIVGDAGLIVWTGNPKGPTSISSIPPTQSRSLKKRLEELGWQWVRVSNLQARSHHE